MFKNTEKAFADLAGAVTQDTATFTKAAKDMVVPAIAEFFGRLAHHANKIKEGVENGEFFQMDANDEAKSHDGGTFADPLPTKEQNAAIHALRVIGKTDEEIAESLNVSVLTVKMAWPSEA